jgi:transposase InsO family protein
MHTIAIDIVGKLPETVDGHQYLLTMIDHFTRWPVAIPIPNRSAAVIAKALFKHLICQYGVPTRILSDREKAFLSTAVKTMCTRFNIKKIETSGYQPQSNGHVERFHRYMNAALTMFVNKYKTDWADYIDSVLFAYRISVNTATGYSPYYLMYGRQPTLPIDLLFGIPQETFNGETEYDLHISKAMTDAYQQVREAQKKVSEYIQWTLNKKRIHITFEKGETVLLWEPETPITDKEKELQKVSFSPQKLQFSWKGPFTIIRKVTPVNYIICRDDKNNAEQVVHVNRLWPFTPWGNDLVQYPLPLDEEKGENKHIIIRPIQPNDMLIVRLDVIGNDDKPWDVARCIQQRLDQTIYAQWYGNYHGNLLGTRRPGWMDAKDPKKHIFEKNGMRRKLYTTDISNHRIYDTDIIAYGFKLTDEDKVPADILRLIEIDPTTRWTHPELK